MRKTVIFSQGQYSSTVAATVTLVMGLLLMLAAADARAETSAPSANCVSATGVAAVVCQTADLADADRRMTHLYAAVQQDVTGYGPSQQRRVQSEWRKTLRDYCDNSLTLKQDAQANCIRSNYNERLRNLAISAFLTDHAAAMTELRRLTPDDAPIYDALYLYTNIDDAKVRTAKVTAALEPVFASLPETKVSYGIDAPKTAADAAASDEAFSRFLQSADAEAGHTVELPCAVLVKRPGLIDALSSYYGGSMDGRLPGTDCGVMAPHVAELDALMDSTDATPCEGTIRFAGYRELERLRVIVMLRLPVQREVYKPGNAGPEEKAFRARKATAIMGARTALAAYYEKAFHAKAKTAAGDAEEMVNLMIGQAYRICGDAD